VSKSKPAKILPVITGSVTVSFTHEDEIAGMTIGPVIVAAHDPYEAWCKAHGTAPDNKRGVLRYSLPLGFEPTGRHDLGWMTKQEAHKVAAHYGAVLEES